MNDDGGSAFPKQPTMEFPDGLMVVHEQGGMTLRDYFAAKALPLASEAAESWGSAAVMAYEIADDMLEARKK